MELHQCPECDGKGYPAIRTPWGDFYPTAPCANCDGTGWLDEHGEPFYLEPETKELSNENK